MFSGVNLLPENKNDRPSILANFLQKQWKKLEQKPELKEYLDQFAELIMELSENQEKSEPYKYYSFIADLEEYKECLRGTKISIYDKGEKTLLFDRSVRKIFMIEKNKYEELMAFSSVKHCRLRYRPVLMQSEKVRFQIDFILVNRNNRVVLKLSETVSFYDEDRRSYEVQCSPYVKTGKAIARTGRWNLAESYSTTF
jgi:hypothetical protein